MWRSVDRGRLYWSKNNVEYIAKEKTKSKWVQFKTVPNINRTYCQWNAINLKKNLHYNIALQETAAIEWMKKNVELFTMFVTDARFRRYSFWFQLCIFCHMYSAACTFIEAFGDVHCLHLYRNGHNYYYYYWCRVVSTTVSM